MSNVTGFEDMSEPPGEDHVEDPDTQYEKAFTQKKRMQELLENPAFILFTELLQKQVDYRVTQLLLMPDGMDDMVRRTYSSGEVAGIKIALAFPKILIETATETMAIINYNRKELE